MSTLPPHGHPHPHPLSTAPLPPRPSQIKFIRPAQMALFAKIICHPPLGQVIVIPTNRKEINFTVVVESSQSFPRQPWEASIWYDDSGYSAIKSTWKALDLRKIDSNPTVLTDGSMNKVFRHTFFGSLPNVFTDDSKIYKGRQVPFTIRYRTNDQSPWQWVKTQFGTPDGIFILQPPIDPNFLAASPVELTSGWVTRKLPSEAPEARLYSIESIQPIPATPEGENAKFESKTLGRVTLSTRFFALVRIWSPWLAPRHGEGRFRLTEDALFCSFLREDGLHVVMLAVNGIDNTLTLFRSNDEGDIVVTARNDGGKEGTFRILVATAWNFEVANCAVLYEMRRMVKASSTYKAMLQCLPPTVHAESVDSDIVLVSKKELGNEEVPPDPQWLQDWYEGLAYCTWNSLGQDLNADKIIEGLDSLAKSGINVSTLIIDDNWQSLDGIQGQTSQFHRGMTRFEGNKTGFPGGMKAFTNLVRLKYPHIRDIAVWHALLGYWGGISPSGDLVRDYKTVEVKRSKGVAEGTILAIHPDDIHRFYNDFYSFLSSSGITAVKTDAQFMLDLLDSTPDRKAMMFPYQSAWTQAHLQHLSGRAISCMSMIPQILYHSFLPTISPRVLLRNSDDFFPDIPSSHPWHVFCNAYNALFVQHLNVLPDWDMFQTNHAYSEFHAAARCVSGGPIYITDTPGQHNVELIRQMVAKNPRGQSVILRPSTFGKARGIYDGYTEGHALKIGVYDGKSETGTGILGVFNISDHEITFMLPLADFPGVQNQEHVQGARRRWIIRSHISKRITAIITPTLPITPDQLVQTTLPVRGYDIWSALPIRTIMLSGREVEFAVIGLLGKMTGACAIIESAARVVDSGARLRIHVQLKALGRLGIWLRGIAAEKVDDLMVMMQNKPVPAKRVGLEAVESEEEGENKPRMLEVDVEGAWDDLGLDAGWGNEVGVEVFVK